MAGLLWQPLFDEVRVMMIERIANQSEELAIIIRDDFHEEGIHFLTPGEYSQQLAYMHHPQGKIIDAHVHNEVHRDIRFTQEVLVLKKGKLRVDFYDAQKKYLESRILFKGDIILLVSGGHGFEVLEEVEMVEIKQGPYVGENDKVRFSGISAGQAVIKERS